MVIGSSPLTSPDEFVAAAPELEALPVVAQRALAMLRDDRASIDALATLLGTDQALAVAVLRYANSAKSMPNRRIANLREAIARIGLRALWEILIHTCTGPMLDRGLPPYGLARRVAWRHAATASVAAAGLSRLLKVGSPDEASVAGLLHDIGKLVFTSVAPEVAAHAVTLARGKRVQVWQAEEQLLGFSHGAVGGALLRSWGLPEVVSEAVARHHRPTPDLSMIVYLADAAAQAVGAVGGGGACPRAEWDMAAAEALGGTPEQLQLFLDQLKCVDESHL